MDVDPKVDGNVPYKIPADNPFAHQPSTLLPGTVTKPELAPVRMSKSFLNLIFVPEVFAYGLQNPWRCSEERRETKKGKS